MRIILFISRNAFKKNNMEIVAEKLNEVVIRYNANYFNSKLNDMDRNYINSNILEVHIYTKDKKQ